MMVVEEMIVVDHEERWMAAYDDEGTNGGERAIKC